MLGLQSYVDASGLEPSLRHLLEIRASQINGCAFCLHMHLARCAEGRRVAGAPRPDQCLARGARRSPKRERAALAWTEAVTLVADTHVPDDVYEAARAEFCDRNWSLSPWPGAINGWNRLMVSFRVPPAVARNA